MQEKTGAPHEHAGRVHAPDAELALQDARDVYARRGPVVSLWVVESARIVGDHAGGRAVVPRAGAGEDLPPSALLRRPKAAQKK